MIVFDVASLVRKGLMSELYAWLYVVCLLMTNPASAYIWITKYNDNEIYRGAENAL